MEQTPIDFAAAAARRDTGIERAVDHADREHDGWREPALAFLRQYASTHVEFMAEDVVAAALGKVPEPPDGRAWGHVLKAAARAGYISKIGYRPAKTSNLSPKVAWTSNVIDLSARFEKAEWLRLARDYIRAFRMNVRDERFSAVDVIGYMIVMRAPLPGAPGEGEDLWIFDALKAEGLVQDDETGLWNRPKPCCADCGGKHG